MNILIVDDDDEDRDLFCETVIGLIPSANCIVHRDAETALKFLRESVVVPDYIFLDVFMGGMDGKEILLKIKVIKHLHRVPVIMYSGAPNSQTDTYKKLGASDFLCKPSSLEALRNLLASILK